MEIILYSTKCPRCNVLETKLKQKHINFIEINDIDQMTAIGLQSAPALAVDNQLLDFMDAIKWVNQQEG